MFSNPGETDPWSQCKGGARPGVRKQVPEVHIITACPVTLYLSPSSVLFLTHDDLHGWALGGPLPCPSWSAVERMESVSGTGGGTMNLC